MVFNLCIFEVEEIFIFSNFCVKNDDEWKELGKKAQKIWAFWNDFWRKKRGKKTTNIIVVILWFYCYFALFSFLLFVYADSLVSDCSFSSRATNRKCKKKERLLPHWTPKINSKSGFFFCYARLWQCSRFGRISEWETQWENIQNLYRTLC